MKKIIALLLTVSMVIVLGGCGEAENGTKTGEVSVFYYSYSDTYISTVRAAMDKELKNAGIKFTNYDGNSSQTTQLEQVQTAVAKGASVLLVNLVDTGSSDSALNILNFAKEKDIPVIFFNRSVEESVIKNHDKCVFVGTDFEMAGHMQGQMIGEYLVENYKKLDINGDGKISYVLFKGQEGNLEAAARTRYAVEDCNKILEQNGLPSLVFYDEANANKYLVDQDGNWSSAAATNYMGTLLAKYNEAASNMVELVIANNDEMALGAIASLQQAGYNKGNGRYIPVFGVDATDAAKAKISEGAMMGTVKQDAEGMASVIKDITENFIKGNDKLSGVDEENIVGDWRVNIPYSAYTG